MQRFPELGERRLVSSGGGFQPVWSPSGRELLYRRLHDDAMMALPVETEPRLTTGNPQVVFEGPYARNRNFPHLRTYDVSADGERFLMTKRVTEDETQAESPVVVVTNWLTEFERRGPAN